MDKAGAAVATRPLIPARLLQDRGNWPPRYGMLSVDTQSRQRIREPPGHLRGLPDELPQHGYVHRLCRLRDHTQPAMQGQTGI